MRATMLAAVTGVATLALAVPAAGQTMAPAGQTAPAGDPIAPTGMVPAGMETLGQAVADAYRTNPQLESQRAQLRAIDEQVIQAASPYRLQAGINGTFAYQYQRQRDIIDNFEPIKNRSMGIQIAASQILLNGGRTAAQVSAAEATVFSGRERLREVENFILLEVVTSYAAVLRDQQLVSIQQRSVDSYTRQVDQARARERGGDLTRTDIAQATAQLEIIRTQLQQAQANLQQSRARFATVVGRNPGQLAPVPQLPGIPISLDMAYRVAEQESPTLWQTIFDERSARANISAQRAERNPVITASGSYGYNSPFSYQTRDLGRGVTGAVTLTMPILSGGIIGSRVRSAIASQQSAQFTVDATRRGVQQQVLTSWNQSISSGDQVIAGQRAVSAAEEALTGVRRGFAEGFRSNFEVIDSEQRLLNAQLIVANADYARYASQATLLVYLGRLQASLLDQAVPEYDAARNLKRQRAQQFGPFQVVLQPIDKLLQVAPLSTRTREAPVLAPATDPNSTTATTPAPSGPLGDAMPVPGNARPPLPEPETAPAPATGSAAATAPTT